MSENRLGKETSPYLLQHKDNPVHWWAWGPEALEEAKQAEEQGQTQQVLQLWQEKNDLLDVLVNARENPASHVEF